MDSFTGAPGGLHRSTFFFFESPVHPRGEKKQFPHECCLSDQCGAPAPPACTSARGCHIYPGGFRGVHAHGRCIVPFWSLACDWINCDPRCQLPRNTRHPVLMPLDQTCATIHTRTAVVGEIACASLNPPLPRAYPLYPSHSISCEQVFRVVYSKESTVRVSCPRRERPPQWVCWRTRVIFCILFWAPQSTPLDARLTHQLGSQQRNVPPLCLSLLRCVSSRFFRAISTSGPFVPTPEVMT